MQAWKRATSSLVQLFNVLCVYMCGVYVLRVYMCGVYVLCVYMCGVYEKKCTYVCVVCVEKSHYLQKDPPFDLTCL